MRRRRERGVALITALLIVALATAAAVAMASRQHLDIRRTTNVLEFGQAGFFASGVEDWAGQVLRRDREKNATDHLGEDWATILPPIDVEGGQIAGRIEDLQGRFNLNNLIKGDKADPVALERFRRLLAALEMEPELAAAVVDWLDADIDPVFPGGAEDDTYLGREVPYRTANGPMVSPSELLLVEGMTIEHYQALAPFVAALPAGTAINVNTAPPEVLMALAEGMTMSDAEALVEGRGDKGFASVEEMFQHDVLAGRQAVPEGLDVKSEYFLVQGQVAIGRVLSTRTAVLHRSERGAIRTLLRAQGTY